MRLMKFESATGQSLQRGQRRPLAALGIALAVSTCGSAVGLAASSPITESEDAASWPLVPASAGVIAREHTYHGDHDATQLRVRLSCRPTTKALTIRIQSLASDGSPSNLLSAAQRGGGYSVPVGRITWGTKDPAQNLWDYFHNEESENVTSWRLDSSDYVASTQAPEPGDFITQLLPIRLQVSNAQGPAVLTIPSANPDVESLLRRCAAFPATEAPPSMVGNSAQKPQSAEAAAVAAYVAQVLATVANNAAGSKPLNAGK
jgi:hypothetical protein